MTKVDSELIAGVKGTWGLDLSDVLLAQLSYHKIILAPNTFGSSSCRDFFHPARVGRKTHLDITPFSSCPWNHGLSRKPRVSPSPSVVVFTILPMLGPWSGSWWCSVKFETMKTPLSLPHFIDEKTEAQRGSRTQGVSGRAEARSWCPGLSLGPWWRVGQPGGPSPGWDHNHRCSLHRNTLPQAWRARCGPLQA